MLRQLPDPLARPQDRVLGRGFVDQIAHPGVPARFDLAGRVFVFFIVDPAGPHWGLGKSVVEVVAGCVLL